MIKYCLIRSSDLYKKISAINKHLKGVITISGDKSISHRSVILSSVANGQSVIRNFSQSADCKSTIAIFKSLGVDINYISDNVLQINSKGVLIPHVNGEYNCGNSGTTMRLVSGILAGQNFNSVIVGDESLSKRPMQRIAIPLMQMGADISLSNGCAPVYIKGKKLHGISYSSSLASAQIKSCVLLAGLNADGETVYEEPYVSRNHTEIMLKYLGADIKCDKNKTIISSGKLDAKDIDVVGDISSAAFFMVAALIIQGSDILIKDVGLNDTRIGIIDIIKKMNGNIEILNERTVSNEKIGDIRVKYTEHLVACEICGSDIPKLIDELPVISILATQAEGETIVRNAEDLRNKETDRILSMVQGLSKLGVEVIETNDGFKINGKTNLQGNVEIETYKDHRLAMSFYVAGMLCKDEILIKDFEWINISMPDFEQIMSSLYA